MTKKLHRQYVGGQPHGASVGLNSLSSGAGYRQDRHSNRKKARMTKAPSQPDSTAAVEVSAKTLASVAALKGITVDALSSVVGVPSSLIGSYFKGRSVKLRVETKRAIADTLGVDLMIGRLKDAQVHVFRFDRLPYFSSKNEFRALLRSLGYLLRGSQAVSVRFPCINPLRRANIPQIHAVQNVHSRVIFIGATCATFRPVFSPDLIEDCRWALTTPKASVANIYLREIAENVLSADVTPIEFDEIFQGRQALSWGDVESTARAHQVSKRDIVAWIESLRGSKVHHFARPTLRSVDGVLQESAEEHSDAVSASPAQKIAVNGG